MEIAKESELEKLLNQKGIEYLDAILLIYVVMSGAKDFL